MAAPPPLNIAPNINPMSGTGSDIHGLEAPISFGDIALGGAETSWVQKAARDVAVGLAVALAARYLFQRLFK